MSAAMAINCTELPELFECKSTNIYVAVGATVGVTLAIVAVSFIVEIILIARPWRAPVSNDSAAKTERGIKAVFSIRFVYK